MKEEKAPQHLEPHYTITEEYSYTYVHWNGPIYSQSSDGDLL